MNKGGANIATIVQKRTKSICVRSGTRACINCQHYRQHYIRGDGPAWSWMPTSSGICLLHDKERGPLQQPCKEFDRRLV